MRRAMKPFSIVVSGLVLFAAGCTHPLEVKNLAAYRNVSLSPMERPTAIGMIPTTDDVYSQQLVKGVGEAMGKYSTTVLLPYSKGSTRPVDAIARMSVRADRKGSGWNFLVNFPGFLVFAPAWNGYV